MTAVSSLEGTVAGGDELADRRGSSSSARGLRAQRGQLDAELGEHRQHHAAGRARGRVAAACDGSAVAVEQRAEQVHWHGLRVRALLREARRGRERFLGLDGEAIGLH